MLTFDQPDSCRCKVSLLDVGTLTSHVTGGASTCECHGRWSDENVNLTWTLCCVWFQGVSLHGSPKVQFSHRHSLQFHEQAIVQDVATLVDGPWSSIRQQAKFSVKLYLQGVWRRQLDCISLGDTVSPIVKKFKNSRLWKERGHSNFWTKFWWKQVMGQYLVT